MHFFDLDNIEGRKELSLDDCLKNPKLRRLELRWENNQKAEDLFNVIVSFLDHMHLYVFQLHIRLSQDQHDLFVTMMYDYLKTKSSIHHFCLDYKRYVASQLIDKPYRPC